MDHHPIAHIDPYMARAACVVRALEENQISRLGIFYRNLRSILALIFCYSWKAVSILFINLLYESRAVCTVREACSAPYIWIANKLCCKVYYRRS